MEVLIYQAVIAGIIIGSAILKGRRACQITAGIAAIWTVTHIFMPWLAALQFGTIVVSYFYGMNVAKPST